MPRRHRFLPADMQAVAVMTRCFQSRLLLLKTSEHKARLLFLGVWAHALEGFPDIQLASLITQPNHYHAILLMDQPNVERIGDFMSVVNGNIARALGRDGTFWQGSYSAVPLAASALERRLKYHLGNGIASGDYLKPKQNPLPNTATAMITEESLPSGSAARSITAPSRPTRTRSSVTPSDRHRSSWPLGDHDG